MLNSHLLKYNQLIINKLFTHHKVLFAKPHKQLIINYLQILTNGHKYPCLITGQKFILEFKLQLTNYLHIFLTFLGPITNKDTYCLPLFFGQFPIHIELLVAFFITGHSDPVYLPGTVKLGNLYPLRSRQFPDKAYLRPCLLYTSRCV